MSEYFDLIKKDRIYTMKVSLLKIVDAIISLISFGCVVSRFEVMYRAYDMKNRVR